MKWLTFDTQEEPGFRFNLVDLFLILFLLLVSYLFYVISPFSFYYLVPVYVGFTFFLFCNVFRIGNNLERVWYVPFILITILSFKRPDIYWKLVLGICEPLKIGLILYRILRGPYWGILHKQINTR